MNRNFLRIAMALFVAIAVTFTACKDDDDNGDDNTGGNTTDETTLTGELKTMTLDATKTYTIEGFVTVPDGVTLTIPAGTLIEAKAGQAENASALIVKQGGKIMAEGTADAPIIFTAEGDGKEGNKELAEQGLWGGLILLGKATTNNTSTQKVEGVPDAYNAEYGGQTDNDNSGTLKYVSIRHGGTDIGSGNEINGLTLAGVGSGTTIDYVEIVANKDDGIEFFGGAAQVSHSLTAYCGDDSYDYDQGFHGKGQFWVAIQTTGVGDRCAEQDGGPSDNEVGKPYAMPTIYNATYIGNGGKLMIFRDNAGGTYANSIFANTGTGIRLEYRDDKGGSSYDMLVAGNISIKNNLFDNTGSKIFGQVEKDDDGNPKGTLPADAETVCNTHFTDNANAEETTGVTKENPVPATASANSPASLPSGDAFFETATYHGAFEPGKENWAKGWTLTFK